MRSGLFRRTRIPQRLPGIRLIRELIRTPSFFLKTQLDACGWVRDASSDSGAERAPRARKVIPMPGRRQRLYRRLDRAERAAIERGLGKNQNHGTPRRLRGDFPESSLGVRCLGVRAKCTGSLAISFSSLSVQSSANERKRAQTSGKDACLPRKPLDSGFRRDVSAKTGGFALLKTGCELSRLFPTRQNFMHGVKLASSTLANPLILA